MCPTRRDQIQAKQPKDCLTELRKDMEEANRRLKSQTEAFQERLLKKQKTWCTMDQRWETFRPHSRIGRRSSGQQNESPPPRNQLRHRTENWSKTDARSTSKDPASRGIARRLRGRANYQTKRHNYNKENHWDRPTGRCTTEEGTNKRNKTWHYQVKSSGRKRLALYRMALPGHRCQRKNTLWHGKWKDQQQGLQNRNPETQARVSTQLLLLAFRYILLALSTALEIQGRKNTSLRY